MTDNYQIDKNSKLFQKFLNLKNNKNNDSHLEKTLQQESSYPTKTNLKASLEKEYVSNKQHYDEVLPQRKLQLHVTISDIEEAASISTYQEPPPKFKKQTNKKQYIEKIEEKVVEPDNYEPKLLDQKDTTKEQHNQSKVYESFKPQRARDRRTRDFSDRNKSKNQSQMQRSFRMNDAPAMAYKPIAPETNIKKQKQNLMSLNEDEQITIKEENMFTLGSREGQYKKKYDKIHQKYEQLKQIVQKQRKLKQQQLNDKEAELQLIRQKYFEVRSNQDTLTSELKRIKQKLQSQNMVRTKFEEEVKELTFKIQELEDMLDGKEANLKKKVDQTSHWKGQNQQLRAEVKFLNAQIEKLEDRCQYLESQNKMVKKDIQNKELLIEELRKNINSIIDENNIAKDQIYKLTIKAYHYQQDNQVMKGDLLRRDREQPHQMSVIQQNYMRSIQSLSPKRRERHQKNDRIVDRQERVERNQREGAQGNNRRRQFARERANTSKPQRAQRPIERQQKKTVPEHPQRRPQQNQKQRKTEPTGGKQRQIIARVQFLQEQLQKRKDQKAMNGKLRRQKIEMERELEQLIVKLNE